MSVLHRPAAVGLALHSAPAGPAARQYILYLTKLLTIYSYHYSYNCLPVEQTLSDLSAQALAPSPPGSEDGLLPPTRERGWSGCCSL